MEAVTRTRKPGFLVPAALSARVPAHRPAESDLVELGEYLAHIMDGNGSGKNSNSGLASYRF